MKRNVVFFGLLLPVRINDLTKLLFQSGLVNINSGNFISAISMMPLCFCSCLYCPRPLQLKEFNDVA